MLFSCDKFHSFSPKRKRHTKTMEMNKIFSVFLNSIFLFFFSSFCSYFCLTWYIFLLLYLYQHTSMTHANRKNSLSSTNLHIHFSNIFRRRKSTSNHTATIKPHQNFKHFSIFLLRTEKEIFIDVVYVSSVLFILKLTEKSLHFCFPILIRWILFLIAT